MPTKTPIEQLADIADALTRVRRRFKAAGEDDTADFCRAEMLKIENYIDKRATPRADKALNAD